MKNLLYIHNGMETIQFKHAIFWRSGLECGAAGSLASPLQSVSVLQSKWWGECVTAGHGQFLPLPYTQLTTVTTLIKKQNTAHRKDPGSISGHYMWDWWWKKRYLDRFFFSEHFGLPLSISFYQYSTHTHTHTHTHTRLQLVLADDLSN